MLDAVIDISHHNTLTDPAALKAAGIVAVWLKATQINAAAGPVDLTFRPRFDQLRSIGFLTGAYAFGCPGDGAAQAELLLKTCPPDGQTPYALDLETDSTSGLLMPLRDAEAFFQRIFEKTGKWPILYTNQSTMQKLAGVGPTLLTNGRLWIANYTTATKPAMPSQWSDWLFWQRDSKPTPGFTGNIDHDLFVGTVDDLKLEWQFASGTLLDTPPVVVTPPTLTYDGLDWPVGTAAERALAIANLPGAWFDANPFTNYYEISAGKWNYHDGADLNKNIPVWNADYLEPIYAIGNGVVTFVGPGGGTWGHIIDIKHPLPDGSFIVSRFGHVANPIVKTGDVVAKGQQVAQVGDGDGAYHVDGAHLHWNISKPNDAIMISSPNQWCGTSLQCVTDHYTDPVKLVVQYKKGTDPVTNIQPVKWLSPARVDVYEETSILSTVVDTLTANAAGQVDKDTWTTGIDGRGYYKVGIGFVAADCVQFQTVATVKRYVNNPNGPTLGANVRSTAAMDSAGNPTGAIVKTLDPATEVQVILGSVKVGKTIMDQVISPVQGYVADWLLSVDRPK